MSEPDAAAAAHPAVYARTSIKTPPPVPLGAHPCGAHPCITKPGELHGRASGTAARTFCNRELSTALSPHQADQIARTSVCPICRDAAAHP